MNKEFMSIIKDRYSVRTFTDKVIDNEIINKIIEVVHFVPTACDRQPLRVIIMNSEESIWNWKNVQRAIIIQNQLRRYFMPVILINIIRITAILFGGILLFLMLKLLYFNKKELSAIHNFTKGNAIEKDRKDILKTLAI